MTSKGILTVALSAIGAAVVFAQAEPPRLPAPRPTRLPRRSSRRPIPATPR